MSNKIALAIIGPVAALFILFGIFLGISGDAKSAECLTPGKVIEGFKRTGVYAATQGEAKGAEYHFFVQRLLAEGVPANRVPLTADWAVVQFFVNPQQDRKLVLFMKGNCIRSGMFVPSKMADRALGR